MILATFADHAKLTALHPLFAQGFDFIEEALKHPPVPGKYDLLGDKLFVRMQEYATNPPEASLWEAHRKYIDIQFMLSGQRRTAEMPKCSIILYNRFVQKAYSAARSDQFFD